MDMMDAANPLHLVENYPVAETKTLIKQLKEDLQAAMSEDSDENEHIDLLMHTIESLEKELAKINTISNLSKEKQARIIADTCFILQFLQSQEAFEDEYDEDEDEDEDEYDDFEDEDEEGEH